MNNRYLSIFLIICLTTTTGLICTGCDSKKQTKIVIKHESKYTKLIKKKIPSHVIDLSDGQPVVYDYKVGPQDPSGPNFNFVTVDMP